MTGASPAARIVYVVLAHRAPHQVLRLVRRLDSGDASFFVHIDKHAPAAVFRPVRDGLRGIPRAQLLPRHRCAWGGFGMVSAALDGLAAAADAGPFDVAVLLSGQDYPVRPIPEIHTWLGERRGSSFLEHFAVPSERWLGGGLSRFTHWHWRGRILGRYLMFPHPRLPFVRAPYRGFLDGLAPFGGSMYWGLSSDAVAHVLDFVRARPDYARFFRHVDVPDESFFHTILLNSRLAGTVVDDDLHYTDWSAAQSHPRTLAVDDLDAALASGKLFARKFDDEGVLDVLDARVHSGST